MPPLDIGPKDLVDFGVAGVLIYLLIKVFGEYQKLVVQLTELVQKAVTVIEANRMAIERLDNQRIIDLTDQIKEIRKADRERATRAPQPPKSEEKAS